MKYQIHIGEVFDLEAKKPKPAQTIIITEDQKQLIDEFANTEKDENLHTIYIINAIKFKMYPFFE